MIGLQFCDCQGTGTGEIDLLQILDREMKDDGPGGGDTLAPIGLAVFDVECAARDARGQLRTRLFSAVTVREFALPCWMVRSTG